MQAKWSQSIVLSFVVAACGGHGAPTEKSVPSPSTSTSTDSAGVTELRHGTCVDFTYDQDPQSVQATINKVSTLLTSAPDCLDPANQNDAACQEVELSFKPAAAWCQSRGRRVLVLDSGMTLGALTRYRQRVLAVYKINQTSGEYEPHTPKAKFARGLAEAMGDTLGDATSFIAAQQLNDVARNIRKFRFPSAHGDAQLSNLANLTPYAQFVLADFADAAIADFCGKRLDTAYFERTAQSMIDLIQRHSIDYINMASGTNLDTLEQSWDRSCGGNSKDRKTQAYLKKIQSAKIAAMQRITAETAVVIVQSALYAPYELQGDEIQFAGDCEVIPNRLRVSYVARADMNFDREGTALADDSSFLFDRGNARACTDFYMGMDWDDNFGRVGKAPLRLTYLGVGAGPQMTMDNSQSSAIGLSYLIYRNQSDRNYAKGLQDKVRAASTPLLFNPMSYDQFELCTLPGSLCGL